MLKVIEVEQKRYSLKHTVHPRGVSVHWNALKKMLGSQVRIVVLADVETLTEFRRQLVRRDTPLLFAVITDELFVDDAGHQRKCRFLEV